MKTKLKFIANTLIISTFCLHANAQIQKGIDINGEAAGDFSGRAVSMPDANTLAIGAPGNDGFANDAGHVRVFSWNGNAWIQKGIDIEGEAAGDYFGTSVSMPDANTVAIGATKNNGNGLNFSGHVRIYTWTGSAWVQKGNDIDGEAVNDRSGESISMPDPNTVAIGARLNDGSAIDAGHVRIYEWNGNAWIQKGTDIDGEAQDDRSGCTVSMPSANTVAIGSEDNFYGTGHVRIYNWSGTAWIQKGIDLDGVTSPDGFGKSVSMPDDNTIAIGGPRHDVTGPNKGHVRIYQWNGSSWIQKGTDIYGETIGDQSGWTISMPDVNTVAISGDSDANGNNSGHVRIFSWNGNAWVQKGVDIDGQAAGDYFGYSISMADSKTLAIGAIYNSGNGSSSGNVRVYSIITTNIQENNLDNEIIIYPNPTNGNVSINLGNVSNDAIVIVKNILGQEIYKQIYINTDKIEFDINQESGIYFVEVNTKNKTTILKLIKN